MKYLLIALCICIFSTELFAQNINAYGAKLEEYENLDELEELQGDDLQQRNRKILTDNPEDITTKRYYLDYDYNLELIESSDLNEDIIMHERNPITGVIESIHNTYQDSHRSSFLFHFDPRILGDYTMYNAEFIYAFKKNDWWFEWFFSRLGGDFETIAQNHTHGSTSTFAEENNPRSNDTQEVLWASGLGVHYRFKLLQGVIHSKRFFETVTTSLAYARLSESQRDLNYWGPGLKVDYGVHRRFDSSYHIGFKLSYNIYSVKRAEDYDTEVADDRSLTLQWISAAFDLSFYF